MLRVFRNSYYSERDGHEGYSFHISLGEAQIRRKLYKESRSPEHQAKVSIERMEFEGDLASIVALLNRCARHNDNG